MDRQTKIMSAYTAVLEKRMSIRGAASHFGVPRATLQDRLAGRIPLHQKRKTSLSPEEEAKFSQWAINTARTGFGRTRQDFLKNIQAFLNQLHEPQPRFKNNNLPGKTWYYDYLKRHPELTERMASALGIEKAVVTPAKVEGWFEALESFMTTVDPSLFDEPARLFNADELGFALCLKTRKVMGPTSSTKTQITTLCCMNATGHFVCPFIVFPGKRLTANPTEHFREGSVGLSESGWMTGDLFVEWLEHVFVKELDECRVKRPVILFVDGSTTHKSKQASDICLKNNIILYCLQPNATHLLKPLDLSFFGSLKHHWGEAVMDYQIKNPGMFVTKSTFSLVFKEAYSKACTVEVARAGFRKAGIFPFSKEAVLNTKKMMTSNLLVGSPTSSQSSSTVTPPVSTPSVSSTPLTSPSSSSAAPSLSSPPPTSSSSPSTALSLSSPPPTSSSSPSAALSLSSPPPTSSSSSSAAPQRTSSSPSHAEILRVLESIMTDEIRIKYATRLEEGYDLLDDPFYNSWKECKLSLSSTPNASVCHSRDSFAAEVSLYQPSTSADCPPSTSAYSPQPSTSAYSPQPSTSADCPPSTSAYSPQPSTSADCPPSTSAYSPQPSTSAYCSPSTSTSFTFTSPQPSTSAKLHSLATSRPEAAAVAVLSLNVDDFLSSQTPCVPVWKGRVVRKVVPNMVLTSEETMAYFKELEETKASEERKKEERKAANELEENERNREEKKRKDMEEKQRKREEKKRQTEEKKREAIENRGKGKGKAAKRLRFEVEVSSSSEDDVNVNINLNDDSDVSVSDVCPGRVDANKCGGCQGVFRNAEASRWVGGCNECERWFHKKCVTSIDLCGLSDQQLEELEFVCDVCTSVKM